MEGWGVYRPPKVPLAWSLPPSSQRFAEPARARLERRRYPSTSMTGGPGARDQRRQPGRGQQAQRGVLTRRRPRVAAQPVREAAERAAGGQRRQEHLGHRRRPVLAGEGG